MNTRLWPTPRISLDAWNVLPSHTNERDAAHRRSGSASDPGMPRTASIRPTSAPPAACSVFDAVAAGESAASAAGVLRARLASEWIVLRCELVGAVVVCVVSMVILSCLERSFARPLGLLARASCRRAGGNRGGSLSRD